MTLHADVNVSVPVREEGVADDEAILIHWLAPMLPAGRVANARLAATDADKRVPFILVEHNDGNESADVGTVDDLVSVYCLYPRGLGNSGRGDAAVFADLVHRRVLLLSDHLEQVTIGGAAVDYDYLDVSMRPRWVDFGDETVLRKLSRYRMGRTYAKLS